MGGKLEPTPLQQHSIGDRVSANPLADYEAAIHKLQSVLPKPSAECVLAALLARDGVNRLVAMGAALDATDLDRLTRLDRQLKQAATKVENALGGRKLSEWKRIMDPVSERWWWSLDNPELRPHVALIVTIILGVSFWFTGDTVGQLLKIAAVSASVAAVLVQAFLTFLSGSALTESGRRRAMEALRSLGFKGQFRSIKVVLLALFVLVLSFIGRWYLPSAVAAYYFHKGEAYASKEDWVQAIGSYNRALTLAPGDQDIHYKLAIAYDSSFQFDRAIDEYKALITAGVSDPSVFNNLARIYIVQKTEDPALRLLDRLNGQLRRLNPDERYHVFKNRGWFKLSLKRYEDAISDLRTALTARDGLAAHYLLGLALEGLNRRDEAQGEYARVLDIYSHNPDERTEAEPGWLDQAQAKRIQGAKK
jgi:tetratricopeptide (TPR) repeat protein